MVGSTSMGTEITAEVVQVEMNFLVMPIKNGPQTFTSDEIMMEAGKSYGLAMISSNYGGAELSPWIQLPGETMEIMNPNASSQNGMYQVVRLSNGESLTTQTSLEANMTGLVRILLFLPCYGK